MIVWLKNWHNVLYKIALVLLLEVLVGCGTVNKRMIDSGDKSEPCVGVKYDKGELSNA